MGRKSLLIMAAGSGSRYGALKQFDELGPDKEFLFEFSIFDAIAHGFDHIVVVTREQFKDDIKKYLEDRLPDGVKIDVVPQVITDLPVKPAGTIERTKPWGTAHAVWVTKKYIHNYFVVINADDFYGKDAFKNASEFIDKEKKNALFGVVPYTLKNTLSDFGSVARGVCNFEGPFLKDITEYLTIERENGGLTDQQTKAVFTGDERVSMNLWICSPVIFEEIEQEMIGFLRSEAKLESTEIYIPRVIQNLIAAKKIRVKATAPGSSWFGVTYANDKELAVLNLKKMAEQHAYPSPLWNI
jgi:UTP-glucose-1-phosphate uridylyltransferase